MSVDITRNPPAAHDGGAGDAGAAAGASWAAKAFARTDDGAGRSADLLCQ